MKVNTSAIAVTALLDGRDWRLELGQHSKLEALQQSTLQGQVDFYASGNSADDLRERGQFQQKHPTLAMITSLFGKESTNTLSRSRYRKQGKDKELRAGVMEAMQLSSWDGRNTYTLGCEPVQSAPSENPSAARLSELLTDYPNQTHVVLVSGHYQDETLAGLAIDELGQTLADSKVDLFVSDGCCLANLEALKELPESLGIAVVSERRGRLKERLLLKNGVVQAEVTDGLPLQQSLPAWQLSPEPLSMARTLVAESAANPRTGFAALNMKNLHRQLLPAVKELATQLTRPDRKAIKSLPSIDAELKKVDLGQVLQLMSQPHRPASVRAAAAAAKEALENTVIEKTNPAEHPDDSGISLAPDFWRTLV